MSFMKTFDTMGVSFSLGIMGEKKYRTAFGGFLTIFSFLVIVGLFFLLGVNFYQRKNPTVSGSTINPENYFNYTLNSSSFQFAFRVENSRSELLDNPEHFYIEPSYTVFQKTLTSNIKLVDLLLNYSRCTKEDFPKVKNFIDLGLPNFFCIRWPTEFNPEGLPVGGLYDATFIQYIKIKLYNCNRGKNRTQCVKNPEIIEEMFDDNIYFAVYLQNYLMDAGEYDEPFKAGIYKIYDLVDLKILKKAYYFFKKGIMYDNKGWFTEAKTEEDLIGLDRLKYDFRTQQKTTLAASYFEVSIYFDKITDIYNRRYMKIQELIANIGGVYSAIMIAFGIICRFYNEFYQKIDLINSFYEIIDYPIEHLSKKQSKIDNKTNIQLPENKSVAEGSNNINNSFLTPRNNGSQDHLSDLTSLPVSKEQSVQRIQSFGNKSDFATKPIFSKKSDSNSYTQVNFKKFKNRRNFSRTTYVDGLNNSVVIDEELKSKYKRVKINLTFWEFSKSMCCRLTTQRDYQLSVFKYAANKVEAILDATYILEHIRRSNHAFKLVIDPNKVDELNKKIILDLNELNWNIKE